MISQRSRYALRSLLELAKANGAGLSAAEISRRQKIPRRFLEQILLDLKREGFVASRRGKSGGYALRRPADTITYGEVLRLVDGPLAPLPCLSRTAYRRCEDCVDEGACAIRRVFARVATSARDVLDRTTIAEADTLALSIDADGDDGAAAAPVAEGIAEPA